jgi:hypothetical protein
LQTWGGTFQPPFLLDTLPSLITRLDGLRLITGGG